MSLSFSSSRSQSISGSDPSKSLRLCVACLLGSPLGDFGTCSQSRNREDLELLFRFQPVSALSAMQNNHLSRRRDHVASTELRDHRGAHWLVKPICRRDWLFHTRESELAADTGVCDHYKYPSLSTQRRCLASWCSCIVPRAQEFLEVTRTHTVTADPAHRRSLARLLRRSCR